MAETKPEDKLRGNGEKIVVKNRGEAVARIFSTFKKAQAENFSDLDFHGPEHPEFVREKALEFAKLIMQIDSHLVSKDTLGNIADAAEAHDSVLNVVHGEKISRLRGFYKEDSAGEAKKRMREIMNERNIALGNEGLSAEWLMEEVDKYVDADGHSVFDEVSREEMRLGIAATLPEFDFSAAIRDEDYERHFKKGVLEEVDLSSYRRGVKVWQPYLTSKSPIAALVIAQADLRGDLATGTDVTEFQRRGDAEFREISEGLRKRAKEGVENMDPEARKRSSVDILNWLKNQVTHAMWQKILFWEAFEQNEAIKDSDKAEDILRAFRDGYDANFDRNILGAKERYERIDRELNGKNADLSSAEVLSALLKEMGFEI